MLNTSTTPTPAQTITPPPAPAAETGFTSLALIEPILRAVSAENYTTPTPIQAKSIPHLLQVRDLLVCAQTRTGKPAAFALPIPQRLRNHTRQAPPHTLRAPVLP